MTTLITGGTGQTGGALAKLLYDSNIPFVVASRSGKTNDPNYKAVTFDWHDKTTYENPFNAVPDIDRVYIVSIPNEFDEAPPYINAFIDFAVTKNVKKFVLLSGSLSFPGGPGTGRIQQQLIDIGVDYTVLRPSWFQENFSKVFSGMIVNNDEIVSSTGDGKMALVPLIDIAQAALDGLNAPAGTRKHIFIGGPEFFTYAEAATLLSSVLGRTIRFRSIEADEQKEMFC